MSEKALKLIEKERQEKTGKLILSFCDLNAIPKELSKLTWLKDLDLGCNPINDISYLSNLTKLRKLNLGLTEYINDISELANLTELLYLNLNNNKINDISALSSLTKLKKLYLNGNKINNINALSSLIKLKVLAIAGNNLDNIRPLCTLTRLKILNIGQNKITNLNMATFFNMNGLISLGISGNPISDIDALANLMELRHLDMYGTPSNNTSALANLTRLKSLNISNTQINDLNALSNLNDLQSLNISNTKNNDCNAISNLNRLEHLNINNTHINDIGPLSNLTGLQSLDLSYTQISGLSALSNLTGLQRLDISNNQINDIKPLLPLIKSGLPVSTTRHVEGINIANNPITNPPLSIIDEGSDAIINWFEQMAEGEAPLFETKLMILGQGDAGKTTFAELLLDENYEVEPGKQSSTLGIVVHKNKEFNHQDKKHQKIKAHLWDFGGQDIQKMLHQFFITENCLYVLVYDKRSENSNFDYWFQIINLLGPKSTVIVLENPKDVNSANEDFPLNKYQELFKNLTIKCVEVNLKYTRNKNKTEWKLLNETIEKELTSLEIVNRPVPQKWTLVRGELEKLGEKYLTKDDFYDICANPVIGLTHEQADLCLFYFRELGDLVYFNDRELCTRIFLDHNWLTNGMYYILADKEIQQAKGQFTRAQAYQQWDSHGYNEEEKAMLLNLLLKDKFDICYELKHQNDVFIAPLLLPNDKPEQWKDKTNLHFRYQYGFIPHGMFSRLLVHIHEKIDAGQIWKTGARLIDSLESENIYTEVQQITDPDENQKVIDIRITGSKEGCKHLLAFLRNAIEDLHKDFKNLHFKRKVACNCDTCIALIYKTKKTSFYDYDMLKAKIQLKKYYVDCEKSGYKEVNIGQILNDIVIENAASYNRDSEFIAYLTEKGITMSQIINNNEFKPVLTVSPEINNNLSNFGNSSATSNAIAEAVNTVSISIEIQNILEKTEMLKEDIERELKIKKVPNEEIELAKSDIEVFENALKDADIAKNNSKKIPAKAKGRLLQFWADVKDENSSIHKALKMLRKGKKYVVNLAKLYNNIPGVPSIPPLALDIIDKL